jgi:serine/threonine protein phosphatase PrpC
MELRMSVLSKPGGRAVNEDAYGVWSDGCTSFYVVSDGAGGHNGGDVASTLAVGQVLDWLQKTPSGGADDIAAALRSANDAVVAAQRRSPALSKMRATILLLAIDTRRASAIWGHIGDTRLYCFRGRRIIAQTRDHSVLQSMVDAGYMQQKDVRASPQRNVLLAALGDVDLRAPDIASSPVRDGDVFLLCTDGFWEYVDEAEMEQTLAMAETAEAWLLALESAVLARGRPGQDNYSALLVSCADTDGSRSGVNCLPACLESASDVQ